MARIILFALVIISAAFPQENQSRPNYHSGNKLRLTFFNDGVIGNTDEFAAEWPIGTGHEYLDRAFPVVAVETGGGHRALALQPVNSFAGLTDGEVAMNYLPQTWPQSWPDRPANWDGKWNGFFGADRLNADQESLYALEDAQTGIQVKVRSWQWSQYLAQDMVFLYYEITNTGSQTFDKVAAGFFAHPTPGSDGDDDLLAFGGNARGEHLSCFRKSERGPGPIAELLIQLNGNFLKNREILCDRKQFDRIGLDSHQLHWSRTPCKHTMTPGVIPRSPVERDDSANQIMWFPASLAGPPDRRIAAVRLELRAQFRRSDF